MSKTISKNLLAPAQQLHRLRFATTKSHLQPGLKGTMTHFNRSSHSIVGKVPTHVCIHVHYPAVTNLPDHIYMQKYSTHIHIKILFVFVINSLQIKSIKFSGRKARCKRVVFPLLGCEGNQ